MSTLNRLRSLLDYALSSREERAELLNQGRIERANASRKEERRKKQEEESSKLNQKAKTRRKYLEDARALLPPSKEEVIEVLYAQKRPNADSQQHKEVRGEAQEERIHGVFLSRVMTK